MCDVPEYLFQLNKLILHQINATFVQSMTQNSSIKHWVTFITFLSLFISLALNGFLLNKYDHILMKYLKLANNTTLEHPVGNCAHVLFSFVHFWPTRLYHRHGHVFFLLSFSGTHNRWPSFDNARMYQFSTVPFSGSVFCNSASCPFKRYNVAHHHQHVGVCVTGCFTECSVRHVEVLRTR